MERYDLRKDGNIGFSHPTGTHDDVFWSIILSVYATAEMSPEPSLTVIPKMKIARGHPTKNKAGSRQPRKKRLTPIFQSLRNIKT